MKRKNFITALLSFVFGCSVLGGVAACTPSETSSDDKPSTSEVLLAGFEDYDELLTYHYMNYFGAAKPQKDFVTQGTGGVALTINGQFTNSQKPTLVIETRTDLLEKGDFSDVSEIKLDVKNENDYAANIYFQYVSSTETGKKSSSAIRQTVEAGYEGTVTFSIDRALMSEFLDLTNVTELRLLFDSPRVAIPTLTSQIEAQANYRKFKADNLRAITTSAPIEKKAVRKEGEIESADKEEYLAAWYMPSAYMWSPSSMAFNTEQEYIKGGDGSFKVVLEGTNSSSTSKFTANWAMSVNQNNDISAYYALHFWLYNESEAENEILFLLNNPVTHKERSVGYLKPGWNEFTFTVNQLRDTYGFDDKNFLFGFTCQAPVGKDHVLYLDEMYLVPFTNPEIAVEGGENVGNVYYKAYNEGEVITLPTPTVKYASGYAVKVLGPDGEEVTVTDNKFTAASKGEYTVTYTTRGATENAKTAETSILLAVGSVPTFNNAPQNVYTLGNKTYTITDKALSSATVSWEVQLYRHRFAMSENLAGVAETSQNNNGYTNGVITGNPTSFYAQNGYDCRVVWTATNADGLRAVHTQHIFADDELLSLDERYGETLYNPQRVGGAISVNESKTAFLVQSDTTKADGVIDNPLMVGYLNTKLRFVIYNHGENPVTVKVNNSSQFTLGAKAYGLWNSDVYGKNGVIGWGLTTADGKMGELKFTFTSEKEGISLEIFHFGVNPNAFEEPTMAAPTYEEYYEKDSVLSVKAPILSGLSVYQYKVYKPDGTTLLIGMSDDGNSTEFTAQETGEYSVEYNATYEDYNGDLQTLTATATFTVIDFELPNFIAEKATVINTDGLGATYTLTDNDKPNLTLSNGETATLTSWSIVEYHRDYMNTSGGIAPDNPLTAKEVATNKLVTAGNELVGITYTAGHSYRIQYKINALGVEFTVYKTLFFVNYTNMVSLQTAYPDFYTNATATGKTAVEGTKITLKGASGADVSGAIANSVDLGNLTKMTIVLYNDGEEDVFMYFNGSPANGAVRLGVKAGHFALLEFAPATLKGWGFMSGDGTFGGGGSNALSMKVYSPKQDVNICIYSLWMNADAFTPVVEGATYASSYETGTQITVQKATTLINVENGEYNVTVQKQGVATPVLTCTHTELNAATPPSFTAGNGTYTITYSVDYTDKFDGEIKTYTKVYTFTASPDLSKVIASPYEVIDYSVSTATMQYTLTDKDKPSAAALTRLNATVKGVTVDSFSRDNITRIGSTNSKNDTIFVKDSAKDTTIAPVINGTDLTSFNVRNGYSYRITYTLEIDGEEFAVYRTVLAMRASEYISLSSQYDTFYTNATYNANIPNGGMSLGADNKSFMLTGAADQLVKGCFKADESVYLGTATTLKMFIYNNSSVHSFVYFGTSTETSACRLGVAAHHFTVFNIAVTNAGAWYFIDTATKTFKANPVYVYGGSASVDIRFVEIAVDAAADFTKA